MIKGVLEILYDHFPLGWYCRQISHYWWHSQPVCPQPLPSGWPSAQEFEQ